MDLIYDYRETSARKVVPEIQLNVTCKNMSCVEANWENINVIEILKVRDSEFTDSKKHKNYVISYEPLKLSVTYILYTFKQCGLSLILRRSRTGTVEFYTSISNKRAARPKLYTKSLTRDLKLMYSRLTLVRIYINL